jgi:hypothetical protein
VQRERRLCKKEGDYATRKEVVEGGRRLYKKHGGSARRKRVLKKEEGVLKEEREGVLKRGSGF